MEPTSPTDPPRDPPDTPDAPAPSTAVPRSRRVPSADGLELHVLEWSRQGVPLLLVHGFGHHAHVWDDLAPELAPYYRVLALDLRGHGDSDRDPAGRYDPETLVRDLDAATQRLGIDRLVLVGHSLGGRVAMRFAAAHPERMAGLVIVDAGPELDWRGVLKIRDETARTPESFASPAEYERLLARALPMAAPQALARLARHGLRPRDDGRFEPKLDPGFRRAVQSGAPGAAEDSAAANAASPADSTAATAAGTDPADETPAEAPPGTDRAAAPSSGGDAPASTPGPDPTARLPAPEDESRALWEMLERIPCPTLVVRGAASDVLAPETAERMAEEALPHGTLAVVPRAAHAVMLENPEGLNEAICGFVLDAE